MTEAFNKAFIPYITQAIHNNNNNFLASTIHAPIDPENIRSRKFAKSVGMTHTKEKDSWSEEAQRPRCMYELKLEPLPQPRQEE